MRGGTDIDPDPERVFIEDRIWRGVPWGSMMGPLLFIIYIKDLPKNLASDVQTIMYADNTRLGISIGRQKCPAVVLGEIMEQAKPWFITDKL